ncbi:uncharacterized protein LOC122130916 isoform X2 [Clupea harengus]|nr:uncharacterized protein LOC122130916 isoform X2 [Clupea harengus]
MLKNAFQLIVLVWIRGSVSLDLNCINDFDRTMMCEFTPKQPANCKKYSLNVVFLATSPKRSYDCSPDGDAIKCGCTIDVEDGFLHGENSNVTLKRNGLIQDSKIIQTTENIKPKTPTIRSANLTTAGKTNVTWLTNYEKTSSKSTLRFLEDLKTELYYKPQKGGEWIPVHEDAMHKTHHELYLEPNTEFIIKARVFISFDKTHFSDWSEEYTFPSGNQIGIVTGKVVAVLIVILFLIACTLGCCFVKIKKEWWSKDFSSPKIGSIDDPSLEEYRILCPEKTPTSRMEVFIPKKDITEEEKSIATFSDNDSSGNSSLTGSTNSSSIPVDYGHTCHVEKDQKGNQTLERMLLAVQHDLERVRQIQSDSVVLPGLSDYETVRTQESKGFHRPSSTSQSNSGCTSGSSFDNECYSVPTSPFPREGNLSFFVASLSSDPGYQSSESFGQPASEMGGCKLNLAPLIQTELGYRSSGGCLISEAQCLPQSSGENQHFAAHVGANESFVKAVGQGVSICMDQTLQSIQEEEKDCALRSVCNENLLQPCPAQECGLLLWDDEYQVLPK